MPQTITIFLFQSHILILSNLVNLLYRLFCWNYVWLINFENLQIFATIIYRGRIRKKTNDPLCDRHRETLSLKTILLLNFISSTLLLLRLNQYLLTLTIFLQIFLVVKTAGIHRSLCEFPRILLLRLQIDRDVIYMFFEFLLHLLEITLVDSLWLLLFIYFLVSVQSVF